MLTRQKSESSLALPTNERWPACSAPMVGTNPHEARGCSFRYLLTSVISLTTIMRKILQPKESRHDAWGGSRKRQSNPMAGFANCQTGLWQESEHVCLDFSFAVGSIGRRRLLRRCLRFPADAGLLSSSVVASSTTLWSPQSAFFVFTKCRRPEFF